MREFRSQQLISADRGVRACVGGRGVFRGVVAQKTSVHIQGGEITTGGDGGVCFSSYADVRDDDPATKVIPRPLPYVVHRHHHQTVLPREWNAVFRGPECLVAPALVDALHLKNVWMRAAIRVYMLGLVRMRRASRIDAIDMKHVLRCRDL